MNHAFAFYLLRTAKNMVLARLRRLRQPKYLLSGLAGMVYVCFFMLRPFLTQSRSHSRIPAAISPDFFMLLEVGVSVILLVLTLLPWLWPGGGGGLLFTEAEVQFLFPAPISRRSLLRLRLIKGQIGIVFGVFISALFFGRGSFLPHRSFMLATLWLVYSFLSLYNMAVSLTKGSLLEHGISGLRRQGWALGLVALTLGSIAVWFKWFIPAPPAMAKMALPDILHWVSEAADSGPAFYILLPFRCLLRPAVSPTIGVFMLRLLPAFAILALVYLWVMISDARFEEASVERSEKVARKLEAVRSGRRPAGTIRSAKSRRQPFALASEGAQYVGIFWKNLISAGRFQPRIVADIILVVLISVIGLRVIGHGKGEVISGIICSFAAIGACFLTILGPQMARVDLRSDLLNLDTIKTYPMTGWQVVLGEISAPAFMLTVGQWTMILIAVISSAGWPGAKLVPAHPVSFGLSAAILLPCISLANLLIQNTAALLFPGWVPLGKAQQRGIEAIGQRLITMLATILVLVLALLPAAVGFAAVFFAGFWLIGLAILPPASLAAAAALLAEAAVAVVWLGHLFDRFDPSLELDATQS